jgi:hypothetical protein
MLMSAIAPPSGKAVYIKAINKHLIQWGAAAPSGTPAAILYFNTAGVTTATVLYVDVAGTWTVLNIT